MADHILVNYTSKEAKEVEGSDYIQGLMDGMTIGKEKHSIAVYRKEPFDERYRTPAEETPADADSKGRGAREPMKASA